MANNIFLIFFTGLLAGCIHVLTGPDHLSAIAPLAARNPGKSWTVGFWWGMGHSGSVWLLAILIFMLKSIIPFNGISQWSEKLVGFVLIGIGIWSLQKIISARLHSHVHEHDGHPHKHYHAHLTDDPLASPHKHSHAPLGIGMIHGLAGSAHLLAIVPALVLPGRFNALSYIAGFGIGTIFAMVCFSWLIGAFLLKFVRGFSRAYRHIQVGFAFLAISVGVFWLTIN